MEREVIERMPADRTVSFETETFPALIGNGLYGMRVDGYWLDIGTPDRYLQATHDILVGAVETSVEPTASDALLAPSLAGEGCEIASDATVGPFTSLGVGCKVGAGAVVERAVLHDSVEISEGAIVRDSIVGAAARVGARAVLEAQTIVGPGESVEPGAE